MIRQTTRRLIVPAALLAAFGGGLAASSASADQPYMHNALDELRVARATLAAGAPDKGGHRVRAMALVDRAIAEVRAGIGVGRSH